MTLASGLQAVAAENAEDAANAASEAASDAAMPPDAIPGFDGNLPTPQQLLEMLESMTGMSDEDKASLREDLLKNIQGQGYASQPAAGYDLPMQTMVLLSLLGVVALVFGKYPVAIGGLQTRLRRFPTRTADLGVQFYSSSTSNHTYQEM